MPIKRFTLVAQPADPAFRKAVEKYARSDVITKLARDEAGNRIYQLGLDPATGEYNEGHNTLAQWLMDEADLPLFLKLMEEYTTNPENAYVLELSTQIVDQNFFDVAAHQPTYPPVVPHPTKWTDLDTDRFAGPDEKKPYGKKDGLLRLNCDLISKILPKLSSVEKTVALANPFSGETIEVAKTLNGCGLLFRPHFTLARILVDLLDPKIGTPEMPALPAELKASFKMRLAVAESKPSGELDSTKIIAVADDKGVFHAVVPALAPAVTPGIAPALANLIAVTHAAVTDPEKVGPLIGPAYAALVADVNEALRRTRVVEASSAAVLETMKQANATADASSAGTDKKPAVETAAVEDKDPAQASKAKMPGA